MRPVVLIVGIGAAAAAAFFASSAFAGEGGGDLAAGDEGDASGNGGFNFGSLIDFSGGNVNADQGAGNGSNVSAFLAMIGASEGAGYQTLYAGGTFDDFSDHPALLGWPGVPLTTEQCSGAGMAAGCVSTAAGRYQIIKPTWKALKVKLGLPDFSPASQDAAAVELIRQAGALELVNAGDFDSAVAKCRRTWASLPGAGYAGQGTRSIAWVRSQYEAAGGSYG